MSARDAPPEPPTLPGRLNVFEVVRTALRRGGRSTQDLLDVLEAQGMAEAEAQRFLDACRRGGFVYKVGDTWKVTHPSKEVA